MIFFAFENQMPFTTCCTIKSNADDDLFYKTKLNVLSNPNVTSTAQTNKSDSDEKRLASSLCEENKNQQDLFFACSISIPHATKYDIDVDKDDGDNAEDFYCSKTSNKTYLPNHHDLHHVFSFCAFEGIKINVLECKDPLTYRFVPGFSLSEVLSNDNNDDSSSDMNWYCVFSFIAFSNNVVTSGTNEIFIQERTDPFHRSRVSMEKSSCTEWRKVTSFFVWDVPMPGTAKHSLQYNSPDMGFSYDATEQSRIYKSDAWGKWNHKLYFYAYPATVCQL